MRRGIPLTLAVVLAVAQHTPTAGQTPAEQCADAACLVDLGRRALAAGQVEEAIALLEEGLDRFPTDGDLQLLLGAAYNRAEDFLWAVDTLERRLAQDPDDCRARVQLAWSYLQLVLLDESRAVLGPGDCLDSGPLTTRAEMVRALIAFYLDEQLLAVEEITHARRRSHVYTADRDALRSLTRMILPNRPADLSWRVEMDSGFTSNALLGAANDPTVEASPSSLFWAGDAFLRWLAPFQSRWRPVAEAQVRSLQYLDELAAGSSSLTLTGRAGIMVLWNGGSALLGYRPELLLLQEASPDLPEAVWYHSGHRGEVEVEIGSLFLFGGVGARSFWEVGRSRTEQDLGLGGQLPLLAWLHLLWALSERAYWTQNPAYTLYGGTLMLNLQARLPADIWLRAGCTAAMDYYPDSAEFFTTEERFDRFLRPSLTAWSPSVSGLRFGLAYQYSHRDSSAPQYEAADHRATVRVTWSGQLDTSLPETSEQPPVPLDWGLDGGDLRPDARIQDLLRQEEQIQRSCGCME